MQWSSRQSRDVQWLIHPLLQSLVQFGWGRLGYMCWACADYDYAQEYNVGKRIEHSYKSIFNNRNSISAVDPKRYSQRFQEFMQKVFV